MTATTERRGASTDPHDASADPRRSHGERAAQAGQSIRVIIVDDQPMFTAGMAKVLQSEPDIRVVGTAGDGAEAVRQVALLGPDVVLMDVRMPGMDGIEATGRITAPPESERPRPAVTGDTPRVIVLTTFQRDAAVFAAIRNGASGFITKDATPEFVIAAIRSVHAGDEVLAPRTTSQLAREFAQPDAAASARPDGGPRVDALAPLSTREREIFLLTARGLSNAEVAAALFVSETTVKTHVRSILAKLGLRSRVQLVVFAYDHRLLA